MCVLLRIFCKFVFVQIRPCVPYMIKLAIVVPCYNEIEVLPEISKQLLGLLIDLKSKQKISEKSYVLFIDDGSNDSSWEKIEELNKADDSFSGLKLARNVGHQNALLAGLHFVKNKCDAAITIDADLQDDVSAIGEMIEKFAEGTDVVYGVRDSRKQDSLFKKITAKSFYKFMRFLGVDTVYNHADFRLLSSRALEELARYDEKNLFIRGVVPLIGFKSDEVYYKRNERFAGTTKYPMEKMVNFAIDGITSFSVKPLRLIFLTGFLIMIASLFSFSYIMISYFGGGNIAGWTSVMISVWFLGALTIMALGIIGEYIGKIYTEVKNRPQYNIESKLFNE